MATHSILQNVNFHDLDFNGICRASALLKFMQNAAQNQLNSNNLGYQHLLNKKRAFILSRITLKFDEPVYEDDAIQATTYPCESSGFSFIRNFELSRNGVRIARGLSVWALIDTDTHNLIKVSDFELGLKTLPSPTDFKIERIRFPQELILAGNYKVAYGDLDRNNHINNTRYPDIYSCFLPLKNKRISSITINYMNEAKFGENLSVYCAETDGAHYIRTVREDGKINSEAEIHLKDI